MIILIMLGLVFSIGVATILLSRASIQVKKVLFILVVFALVGTFFLKGSCSRYLRRTNPLFNFFFTPEDFYQPLAQSPFSTSSKGRVYECGFIAKYPGNHAVEIFIGTPVKVFESYDEKFSVEITMKDMDGAVLLKEKVEPPFIQFWVLTMSLWEFPLKLALK